MNKIKSGVYKIECLINGKIYIGSSMDIKRRWNQHRSELNRNIHSNKRIKEDWDKYGCVNFKFDVIEYCDSNELFKREQYYIDKFKSYDPNIGYNIAKDAQFAMLGRKHTKETKHKFSEMRTGKNNHRFGKHLSEEEKQHLREVNSGSNNYCAKEMFVYNKQCELINKFDCINDCGEWLVKNNYVLTEDKRYASHGITESIKHNKPYANFVFGYTELTKEQINEIFNIKNDLWKKVYMYDYNGELVQEFNKINDCARYLLNNGYTTTKSKDPINNVGNIIMRKMKVNKIYLGFIFSYVELSKETIKNIYKN